MKKFLSKSISIILALSILLVLIPQMAFADISGDYIYTVSNGNATITEYRGMGGAVTIPSTLGGYPVLSIGDYAFRGRDIGDIVLVDTITTIGDYAFYNCNGIGKVTIGNGVTSIGKYAFGLCGSLRQITLGSSLKTIGESAFYSCVFESIDIGSSITSIGYNAFYRCYKLLSINVDPNNENYCSENGILFNQTKTTLIEYPERLTASTYTIPNSVVTIGAYAFSSCYYLKTITFGNDLATIEEFAFESSGIKNAIMVDSVTSIGEGAFSECSFLSAITIGDKVTTIGEQAFYGCNDLTTVSIGNGVINIGKYAFGSCDKISSVTIGNNVKTIGEKAFYVCFALKTITIPSSVLNIGGGAFLYCNALTEIKVDNDNTNYCSLDGVLFNKEKTKIISYPTAKTVTTYSLPSTVTVIGAYAFAGYGGVTEVIAGNGITTIEEYAFSYSYNLKFKASLQNIITIGNNAFEYNCVTAIIAGNKLTTIGDSAFIGCYGLSEINAGTALKTIGDFAFSGCQKLAQVTLGNSLISIGASAFNLCANLKTIAIYGNSTIGSNAFTECGKLTTVIIGEGVKSIGEKAFYGCIVLTNVYFLGNAPTMGQQIFDKTSTALRLYYLANKTGFKTPYWYGKYSEVFPATPKGLKATSLSYNSIKLTWNACNNVDGYVVYKFNVAKNVFEYLATTSLLSFTHQSLITGTKYYYKIYSYKTLDGKKIAGAISGYVTAIPALTVPATLTVARASSSSIKLTWAVVAGASGYTIYRYNSSTKLYSALTNTVATYYTNKGLSKGVTYYYKVAAYRLVGNVKVYGGLTAVKSAKTY